jgi:zinc protease
MKKLKLFSFPNTLCLFFSALIWSPSSQALDIAFEKDSSLPIVYLNVAIKLGSVTDPAGQAGLTNFMGEMMMRGTKSKTKEQIDFALDQMGARLDVEARAEALIFRGAVLSSQLDSYLGLLNDILTQPTFPVVEIKKLQSEIVSALQEEQGHDASLAGRQFTHFLFQSHPYGKPIMGNIADIESLTATEISDHYRRLLQDKYLLVVGSGDTSESKISDWAKQVARQHPDLKLSDADEQILAKVEIPKNSDHRRVMIVDKPDRTQTQINLGQIGVRMDDPDYFPLHLGNYAFGGPSFSAILMVEIRVKRGWSYGANSNFRFGLQPRSWIAHFFPAEKDSAAALAESVRLISDLQEKGLTSEQFEFAKRSLVNSAGFMYNTPKKRVENKLLEKTLNLPDGYMQTFGPETEKVKLSEVNNSLKKFLKPGSLAISVLGTAKNLKESVAKAAGIPVSEVLVVPYTDDK